MTRLPVRAYPWVVCGGWQLTAKSIHGRRPLWDRDPDSVEPKALGIFSSGRDGYLYGPRRRRERARAGA